LALPFSCLLQWDGCSSGSHGGSEMVRRKRALNHCAPAGRRLRILKVALAAAKGTARGLAVGKRSDKDSTRELGMDGAKVELNGNTGKAGDNDQEEEIKLLGELFAKNGKVVAFTGAGVSAESGVPTYRDPGGLWRKYE